MSVEKRAFAASGWTMLAIDIALYLLYPVLLIISINQMAGWEGSTGFGVLLMLLSIACITAAIVATAVLHQPTTTTTAPETPPIASNETTPIEETQDVASLQTTPEQPVETQNLASRAAKRKSAHKDQRRLQAENAKLARENERLQRELADLKRRAFIIDLEANGFRAVQDEDGSIVLIDLEQEIENELNNHLNNQPTTNIPAL